MPQSAVSDGDVCFQPDNTDLPFAGSFNAYGDHFSWFKLRLLAREFDAASVQTNICARPSYEAEFGFLARVGV
jgi:hypothetical protein